MFLRVTVYSGNKTNIHSTLTLLNAQNKPQIFLAIYVGFCIADECQMRWPIGKRIALATLLKVFAKILTERQKEYAALWRFMISK